MIFYSLMDSIALGPFRAFAANYFYQYDEALKTSKKKKFSKLVKNSVVQVEDLSAGLASGKNQLHSAFRSQFDQFRFELEMGFSLLFYGFGSKIELIEEFCIQRLPDSPIIIVDALSYKFNPAEFGLQLKSHLSGDSSIGRDTELEALYSSLCTDLSQMQSRMTLLLCGLEKLQVEDLKLISMIAQVQNIFFIAMIENPDFVAQSLESRLQKRFQFVFHDLTTFVPYNYELGSIADSIAAEEHRTEMPRKSLESIKYVLASLPAKSLKLLKLLVDAQLRGKPLSRAQTARLAMDSFIISSENGLLLLLNEFIDHQIMQITDQDVIVVCLESEELPKLRSLLP